MGMLAEIRLYKLNATLEIIFLLPKYFNNIIIYLFSHIWNCTKIFIKYDVPISTPSKGIESKL